MSSTATFKERTIIIPATEIIERSFCYNPICFFIPMAHIFLQWAALCFVRKWWVDGDAVGPGMGLPVPGCLSVRLGATLPKQESFLPFSLFTLTAEACWTCVVWPDKLGLLSWLGCGNQAQGCPASAPGQTWLRQLHIFFSLFPFLTLPFTMLVPCFLCPSPLK